MSTPLHVLLRQYRVIAVVIVCFSLHQTHYLTMWFLSDLNNLTEWQNAGFGSIVMAHLGILSAALKHAIDEKAQH